jgi:hypothetical protein
LDEGMPHECFVPRTKGGSAFRTAKWIFGMERGPSFFADDIFPRIGQEDVAGVTDGRDRSGMTANEYFTGLVTGTGSDRESDFTDFLMRFPYFRRYKDRHIVRELTIRSNKAHLREQCDPHDEQT